MRNNEVVTRKEYIEREAAVMKIWEWFWSAPGVHPKLDRDTAEEIMFAIPAADVVPVVHGHWIQREDYDGALIIPFVSCSSCHYDWDFETPFCPNCGALMDKDGDGDV